MKVMGIRVNSTKVRYALIECNGEHVKLLNKDGESRLQYPSGMNKSDEKVGWLYRELDDVFRKNKNIKKVCIKTNEYGNENKPKREAAYLEGVVLFFCNQKNIPIEVKIYKSLKTNSNKVLSDAKNYVDRTTKYWDKQMADAIMAAWGGVSK